jgi:putative selenium metabolism hydrolase
MEINNPINSMGKSVKNDLVKFLRDMIRIPSLSGKEGKVIKRMQQEMIKIGYDEVWIDPFGNLIGRLGSGNRIMAIDGHCDTVGIGNPDTWEIDPFEGEQKNNIIYGRGASDQKSGLASAIYAGKILKEIGIPKNITLYVVASVLEEDFEGLCWQYILGEKKFVPEMVLLTEPTDLNIKIGQKGRLEIKVKTRGISSHGSAPEHGENAIYKMAPIINNIQQLNPKLRTDSILGKGTLTITDIRSTAPSLCAVADSATIHLDRRLTHGETLDTACDEIANLNAIKTAQAEISVPEYKIKSYTGLTIPVKAYYPVWMMDKKHPLVQNAKKVYESQFKKKADIGVWAFSTNGVATKGIYNIPTIGFGPGKEEHAHTPADQVEIGSLVEAMMFYTSFVLHFGDTRKIE